MTNFTIDFLYVLFASLLVTKHITNFPILWTSLSFIKSFLKQMSDRFKPRSTCSRASVWFLTPPAMSRVEHSINTSSRRISLIYRLQLPPFIFTQLFPVVMEVLHYKSFVFVTACFSISIILALICGFLRLYVFLLLFFFFYEAIVGHCWYNT